LALPNPVRAEYHLLALLSGLRRNDLETMRWENVDLPGERVWIPSPKCGVERKGFHLILSAEMIALLQRVMEAGRLAYPQSEWVFPGAGKHGHMKQATADRILTNHALRRSYATMAKAAGVAPSIIDAFLDHRAKDVTGIHYVKAEAMSQFLAGEQAKISAAIM